MATNTNTGVQTPAMPSQSTKAQQSVTSETPRPHWCIQRDDNTVVPLIAIDELPDSVVLKDVPATLTVLEALKARMELITGDHPAHGVRYQLDQPINTKTSASEQGDDSGSDGSPSSEGSESSAQKGFTASDKKGNKNAKEKTLRHPTLMANDTSIIDAMAKKGTMGKKVYCTYWIQTGNCNYMQEGCKYKHEIPKDEETRRAIGFREFPNWPREELPIQPKPVPALHKPWRRQDGKPAFPGTPSPANHRVTSPPAAAHGTPKHLAHGNNHASAQVPPQGPAAHGTPKHLAHGNNHASANVPPQGPATTNQFNPNATAFSTPHQHFPNQANYMAQAQQRLSPQGGQPFIGNGAPENYQQRQAQNNTLPPSYNQSTSHVVNGGRTGSSSPPKQPPIGRPTNLGQSAVVQQNKTPAPPRRVAPDYHILNRASGASGTGASGPSGSQAPTNPPPGSGFHNNWNPQTNAPTSMDISFIAPSSDSARSGGQAIYTPNYTPSNASVTPTPNASNTFGSMNGNASSNSRAGTPAHYNRNAFTNNGNVPIKGRGPVQFGRNSPAPSAGSARNNPVRPSSIAEESDATSITSPPVMHRAMFREPGEPEFVSNPPEIKKAAHGAKKHSKKAHAAKGDKSAKNKMTGNGYDVLVDMHDHQ